MTIYLRCFAYWCWYHEQLPSVGFALVCLAFGYIAIGIQQVTAETLFSQYSSIFVFPKMMNIGILLQALGWFILFSHIHLQSRIINWIAQHVFGIYLITEFVPIRDFISKSLFNYGPYYGDRIMSIAYPIAVTLLICVVCILLATLQSIVFKLTIDQHQGYWFELFWNWCQGLLTKADNLSNNRRGMLQ